MEQGLTSHSTHFSRSIARILHWGVPKLSAEGARIEASKAPRGMGIAEGVYPSPTD